MFWALGVMTNVEIKHDKANRLKELPPYLFVELDRAKKRLEKAGHSVIDLGVGDPDLPTPAPILNRLKEAAANPEYQRYPSSKGLARLRKAIAVWYERRFQVRLDPETEIVPLIGSKEGIAHLPLALTNPGDTVLVPDPGYPPYAGGAILAGAVPVSMPLTEANGFFPDLGAMSQKVARAAKIMYLNYPNNPTAAVASTEQFTEAIALAKDYGIAIAHDAAYSEVAYDGYKPMSFLQVPEAKSVGIEFHSFSKTYNMTGWRIGWACGNPEMIAALTQLKTNMDSGVFEPIQEAAVAALEADQDAILSEIRSTYQSRRDLLVDGLNAAGWPVARPKASLYVWTRVPTDETSMAFCARLLEKSHVVIAPGVGFGASGEGYVRFSLTVATEQLKEAIERLKRAL